MDNYNVIVDDWIRSLRILDHMRSQVIIERIWETFQSFDSDTQRSLILTFLQNVQQEHSEFFIKNFTSCLAVLNQHTTVSPLELLQKTVNPEIAKYYLIFTLDAKSLSQEMIDALISNSTSNPFSPLFSHTINLITENVSSNFVHSLKNFYILHSAQIIEHYNGTSIMNAANFECILSNIHSLLISLNHFKVQNLFQEYKHLLAFLCANDIYSPFDPHKKKISYVISQLFYNIALEGNNTLFLLSQFQYESSDSVKIAIIHKLCEPSTAIDSGNIIKLLREIAKDDNFFVYTLASMVKIGGLDVINYILSELKSNKCRRVFFTTYFLPYLDLPSGTLREIVQELLKFKQPLILKQALWVIRKTQSSEQITHVVKLLFHDNEQVRNEAQKVLLEAPNSLDHLTKTMHYYGPEKQEILSHLIAKLSKLNP